MPNAGTVKFVCRRVEGVPAVHVSRETARAGSGAAGRNAVQHSAGDGGLREGRRFVPSGKSHNESLLVVELSMLIA